MAELGVLNCDVSRANTGWGRCAWEPGLIVGAIPVPKGYSIVNADITDPAAWILALIHNDNDNLRGNPFPTFVGLEATIAEAQAESFGYGGTERSGVDFVTWMAKWRKGKMCSYKSVRTYDGTQEQNDWLYFDNKGRVLAWSTDDTTANGFDMMDIYVKSWTPAIQSANVDYQVGFTFEDATQLNDYIIAIETGLSYSELVAIQSVNLIQFSSITGGVFQITARESCGGVNLGETYTTTLAVVGAWRAYNNITGLAITISAVSYNAITGRYTVDLDGSDPDFTTATNGTRIELAPPSVLSGTYSVEWYKSIPLITTAIT